MFRGTSDPACRSSSPAPPATWARSSPAICSRALTASGCWCTARRCPSTRACIPTPPCAGRTSGIPRPWPSRAGTSTASCTSRGSSSRRDRRSSCRGRTSATWRTWWRRPTWEHLLALPDFHAAAVAAIEGEHVSGVYNLGDDQPVTLQEFLDTVAGHWGFPKPWRLPRWCFPLAGAGCEAFAALFGTAAPLTRDFVTIGMASTWADTSRMKRELLPRPAHGGGGGDRRVDDPRTHGGDRDAVRAKLLAQRLGEAEDGELGRAVGRELGGGEEAGSRGDVHHVPAAAAPHHGRKEEVAAVDHAPEVDREDPPPVLERGVEKAAAEPHAGVVD